MPASRPPRLPRGLPRPFFARGAEDVAKDLLGKVLVRRMDGRLRRARIVETEAYVGTHDLAAHSSKGRTPRNESMWGPPGRAYVYFIYGMHWMLNVVCSRPGDPQAVLVRAAEPLGGWDVDLRGPALVARSFGVTRADDGADLVRGSLRVCDGPPPADVTVDRRVGVDYAGAWAHAELRFLETGSPFVSRPPRHGGKPRPQRPHS